MVIETTINRYSQGDNNQELKKRLMITAISTICKAHYLPRVPPVTKFVIHAALDFFSTYCTVETTCPLPRHLASTE
jgi:hypothetical protein